jgi:hypothetical protein
MNDLTQQFFSKMEALYAQVLVTHRDVLAKTDIAENLAALTAFKASVVAQPATAANSGLETHALKVRIIGRERAVRQANHQVSMTQAMLKKLDASLNHNLAQFDPNEEIDACVVVPGITVPLTRHRRIEQLNAEIAVKQAELEAAHKIHKKAETLLKSDRTREQNLERAIALAISQAHVAQDTLHAKLSEMIDKATRTIRFMKNRQAVRDTKGKPSADRVATDLKSDTDRYFDHPTDAQLRDLEDCL